MKSGRILLLIFIFSLLFGIMEISWLLYYYSKDLSLIFTESLNQFVLAGIILSFFVAFLSIRKYVSGDDLEIVKPKNIEKSIKEIYQYEQLLNPPEVNN